jgi:hypothetical protein
VRLSVEPVPAFYTHVSYPYRSKKETERLHQLHKPERPKRKRIDDDLPSVDSHSDDGELWDSDVGEELLDSDIDDDDLSSVTGPSGSQDDDAFSDSDAEMPYETAPRGRRNSWDPEDTGVSRLPIKLANGEIQKSKEKVVLDSSSEEEEESEEEPERQPEPVSRRDDVATGARFGRPAVVDVIGKGTRKARIQAAREQIASICQEILSDPENSVSVHLMSRWGIYLTVFPAAWSPPPPTHVLPSLCHDAITSRTGRERPCDSALGDTLAAGRVQGRDPWLPHPPALRQGEVGEGQSGRVEDTRVGTEPRRRLPDVPACA